MAIALAQWPSRSPDLTPLDFYLWGRLKAIVYSTPVNTRDELMNRVVAAINGLQREEIRKATRIEVEKRILKCLEQNGRHIEHI